MTVSETSLTPQEFTCSGVTTFPVTNFTWIEDSSLVVTHIATDETRTELTLDVDFTVASTTITWAAAPASGTLHVTRSTSLIQELNLVNAHDFDVTSVNLNFDMLILIAQELLEMISRCVRIPATSPSDVDVEMELPEASTYLAFNADADGITQVASQASAALVSTFAETILDDENATEVLATLDLTISTFVKTLLDDASAAAILATLGFDASVAEIDAVAYGMPAVSYSTEFAGTIPTSAGTIDTLDLGAVKTGDIFLVNLEAASGTKGGTGGAVLATLTIDDTATCTIDTSGPSQFNDRRTLAAGETYDISISGWMKVTADGNLVIKYRGLSVGSTVTGVTGYLSAVQLKNAA